MTLDYMAVISYVVAAAYTPGPNNISCASMGHLYGYGKTRNYIFGIALGHMLVLLCASLLSAAILENFPFFEKGLRWGGCLYILWLAWKIYRATYEMEEGRTTPILGFWKGVFLQFLNPKGLVFAFTLYATLLAPWAGHGGATLFSILLIGADAFVACSCWALFGVVLRKLLRRPRLRQGINTGLALLLVYTALSLLFS